MLKIDKESAFLMKHPNDMDLPTKRYYEQAKLFGDALLAIFVIAYYLKTNPHGRGGDTTMFVSTICCAENLAAWADKFGISKRCNIELDSTRLRSEAMETYLGYLAFTYGVDGAFARMRPLFQELDIAMAATVPVKVDFSAILGGDDALA
jgi:dsRNA-specific ribonuclease